MAVTELIDKLNEELKNKYIPGILKHIHFSWHYSETAGVFTGGYIITKYGLCILFNNVEELRDYLNRQKLLKRRF